MLMNLPQLLLFRLTEPFASIQPPQRRGKNERHVPITHNVAGKSAGSGLEAPVGDPLEPHAGDVVRGGLFGVADVPVDVVVAKVLA